MPVRPHSPRASRTQLQRAHLRLHVSLHVEGRLSAESFRLDCGAPTPSGHQDCRQCGVSDDRCIGCSFVRGIFGGCMVGLLVVLFVPLLLSFLVMPDLCRFLRVIHTYGYRMSGCRPYNAVCSIIPSIRNIRNCNIRKHTASRGKVAPRHDKPSS